MDQNPLLMLASSILALWITGLGLAMVTGQRKLATRYVSMSFRLLRSLAGALIELVGNHLHSLFRAIAKSVKG